MVRFQIEMDGITWEVTGDEAKQEYLDKNSDKINKYMNDLDYVLSQIRNIEFILKSESLKFSLEGEDKESVNFYFYRDNIGANKATMVFYEMIIEEKNSFVEELKHILKEMTFNDYIINYTQSVVDMVNRMWIIDQNYFLKSFLIAEEG